jgi:hypothetical protein
MNDKTKLTVPEINIVNETLGTGKHAKKSGLTHETRSTERALETTNRKRVTIDALRKRRTQGLLPEVLNPDPDYKYKWFSLDPNSRSDYYMSVSELGYSPVTVHQMPEMAGFVFVDEKVDKSIAQDKIVFKEMILCQIRKEDWETIMTYNHHVAPTEEASAVYERFNEKGREAQRNGVRLLNQDAFEGEMVEHEADTPYAYTTGINGIIKKIKPKFK